MTTRQLGGSRTHGWVHLRLELKLDLAGQLLGLRDDAVFLEGEVLGSYNVQALYDDLQTKGPALISYRDGRARGSPACLAPPTPSRLAGSEHYIDLVDACFLSPRPIFWIYRHYRYSAMEQRLVSPQQLTSILTARRRARGMNQAAVALPLHLSQNRYSELEQEPSKLTLDRLLSIAHVLGLEIVIRDASHQRTDTTPESEW